MAVTLAVNEGPSPMSWPLWWRIAILLNVSFYNMMGNVFSAGVAPLFGSIAPDLRCTTTEVSRLPGYAMLMLGVGNLFALPAAEYVGKRNTTILSMATLLLSNIWAANVQSYGSLVGSRFIGGLAGGVIEALGPQIVAECFPNRHLGQAMVVYVGFLAAGSSLGPIAAGAIATRLHSWRWFFNISAIAVGLNLLSSLLMFPETTYPLQQHIDGVTSFAAADSSSNTLDNLELRTLRPKTPSPIPRTSSPTLVNATTADDDAASIELHTPLHPPHPPLLHTWLTRSLFLTVSHGADRPPRRGILSFLRSAAPLLVTPPVLVTTLLFGLTIGWTVVASIVVSAQYSAPPWLFDAERVGFLNWGPLVGLLVGIPVGGAVADVLYGALAARKKKAAGGVNGGGNSSDPRHRLPAVLPGAVVSPAGWLVMGFALRDGWAWGATSAGWGMAAFGLTASANVMLTYVVDCFPGKAGEIGVLVNGMKNFFAFGVSYGSLAWYESAGAMGQFATMAGLSWAVYAVVPVLYFWRNKRSDLEW